jgi:hypothetical protein
MILKKSSSMYTALSILKYLLLISAGHLSRSIGGAEHLMGSFHIV